MSSLTSVMITMCEQQIQLMKMQMEVLKNYKEEPNEVKNNDNKQAFITL